MQLGSKTVEEAVRGRSPTKRQSPKRQASQQAQQQAPKLTSLADKRKEVKKGKRQTKASQKATVSLNQTLDQIKAEMGIILESDEEIPKVEEVKNGKKVQSKQAQGPPSVLLMQNSSQDEVEGADWVHTQTRDRATLQSLSAQKRQLRLKTLQTTFDQTALADPEKLTELRSLVSRIQIKIERFWTPVSSEKYLSLDVKPEHASNELREDSELMEDLYKILPLTVETVFDEAVNAINCQFDTLADLRTAENILELVFSAKIVKKTPKQHKTLLQSLLQAIWCRKRADSAENGKDTPVKQPAPPQTPLLFTNKKSAIEFNAVIQNVKEALGAFDKFTADCQTGRDIDEDELDAELDINPNLIIPFIAEDDCDSDFALMMKKCRKPRTPKPKTPSANAATKSPQQKKTPANGPAQKRTYKKAKATLKKVESDSFAIPLKLPQLPDVAMGDLNLTGQTTTTMNATDTSVQSLSGEPAAKRKKRATWNVQQKEPAAI